MTIPYKQLQRATVRQHDQADCGVACLQTILKHWGKTISMEQLRDWSGTNASGTTMLGLKQAAIQTGLEVDGYEADLDSLKACTDICILHIVSNNFYHYLVYWGYDEALQRYIISDPGKGTVEEYTAGELDDVWQSKTLLLFKLPADAPQVEENSPQSQWRWMWSFLQEDLNLLGMAVVIGVVLAILGISTAVFSQQLIDHILPNKDYVRLYGGISLLLVLLFARSALGYVRQLFLLRQARDFNLRIVQYFFESLLHLPKAFFDNRRTGDLVARMHDTSRIQRTVSQLSASSTIDLLMILVVLIGGLSYNWVTGVVMLAWLPLFFWIAWRYHQPILKSQKEAMISYSNAESTFVEAVQGAGTIKLFNRETHFIHSLKNVYAIFQQRSLELGKVGMNFGFWTELLSSAFTGLLLLYISWHVLRGGMTVGSLMAVLQMSGMLIAAAARLAMTNIQLQEARVAFDRMKEFTGLQAEFDPNTEQDLAQVKDFQELQVQNLSFRFPGRNPLFESVSLSVKKGELAVLMGETGSGKSTLLQTLQKFYKQEQGKIKVNGIDLDLIATSAWRNCLGVVEQEVKIFNGSLAENILFGSMPESPQLFFDFLEQYGFSPYFDKFPQGVNTLIGQNGISPSGGQKQMIGLARALWKQPQLLLLDEPSSALDQSAEAFVHRTLMQLKSRMGILLLTHRSDLLDGVDKVYKIEGQMIVSEVEESVSI